MKTHLCEQGSAEWLALRLGRPTASEFHRIVTPTGKLSTQSRAYAHRLVAERLLNRPMDSIDNLQWVAHGKTNEAAAGKMLEFEHDMQTRAVGFITTDDGQIGASPDRLIVGMNGAVEIKCCSPQVHVGYMLDGFGADYIVQVQGQMLVGEFDFVIRYGFHPEMPSVFERTNRDEPLIARLRTALDEFNDRREEMYQRALASGAFQVAPQVQTAHEQAYAADPGPQPYDGFDPGLGFGGAFA